MESPAVMSPPSNRETHAVKNVDIQSNSGEREPMDADMQTKTGETKPYHVKLQTKSVKTKPADVGTQSVHSKVQPDNEDTKAEPIYEEMRPSDSKTHSVASKMHLYDGEKQPLDAQVPLVNEEMQPNNVESHPLGMQLNNGGSQTRGTEMLPRDVKKHEVIEDVKSGKEEIQTDYADLLTNNGEIQVDVRMQLDSEDIQAFGGETQMINGEFQSFYAEFQPDSRDMQPCNPETHPHDVEIQPYDTEVQLHGGQIQPYNPEMQRQDGQIQLCHPKTEALDDQIQQYNPDYQPNKRRKRKSMVWDHFTIENVSPECRRASCNRCKQSFAYSTGSKVAGTSHLKRHIVRGTCASPLQIQEGNQLSPNAPSSRMPDNGRKKRQYRSYSSLYVPFDQDRCRQEIAKMIIMHEYPLDMVEHPGFMSFVQSLQPRFNVGSFSTVQGDCIAFYLSQKQYVKRLIEGTPGRVCLTVDLCTSKQTTCYVVISGHFIDSDWKFNRRILNVVMEPDPDSDTVLSHAINVCLSEWTLEGKIFSVTSNQKLSQTGIENLRAYLAVKNPHILNGQLLIGNCIGLTLGGMANDLLVAGEEIVKKIRDSIKYVKTSDSHEEKFLDLKRQLQVPGEKKLVLDDQTKWNTTYDMLLAASELNEVFSCLDTTDSDYNDGPSMEEWNQVEKLCTYLKLLYDAANILTNTTNPTPITCFHEVWKIHTELGRAVSSEDPFIVHVTNIMQEKLVTYWKDCSLILAMAVVMDPRFKMKLVEFIFTKLYSEDAPIYVRIVDEGIHELFDEYVALPLPPTQAFAEERHGGNNIRTDGHAEMFPSEQGLADFDMYIMETTSQQMKSEIDQYLEESLLPRVQEFDVLSWWKLNQLKYPTLSRMARDILATPMCTVTSETIFDTVPKMMDAYRCTLRPVTVEALICAKDWLLLQTPEVSNAPPKMEI